MIDRGSFRSRAWRVLLVTCLTIVLGSGGFAQGKGGRGGRNGDALNDSAPQAAPVVQYPDIVKVDKDLKTLTKLLTLTSDQQEQVKDILTKRNTAMEELIKQYKDGQKARDAALKADVAAGKKQPPNLPPGVNMYDLQVMAQARTVLKALRAEVETKIVALLTDSQKTTYDAWKAKRAKQVEQDQAMDFRLSTGPSVISDIGGSGGEQGGGRGGH